MEDILSTKPHDPVPTGKRFGVPGCWILFVTSTFPFIALIGFTIWLMATEGGPGFPGGLIIAAAAMMLLPPSWGLSVASLLTALVRRSKIKRYNRENGTSERGVTSATVCASLSAIGSIGPLLTTAVPMILSALQTSLHGAMLQ